MKSKSLREVVLTDSPALTAVISYWKEYDKDSVILSFLELKRRNYEIKGNIEKKLTDFSTQHQKELSELVSEYKKENDFENGDDILALFDMPGLVYAVGGRSPGRPWYFGSLKTMEQNEYFLSI